MFQSMEKVKEENELQELENLITNLEKKSHNADDADADEATADSKLLANGHDKSPVYNEGKSGQPIACSCIWIGVCQTVHAGNGSWFHLLYMWKNVKF